MPGAIAERIYPGNFDFENGKEEDEDRNPDQQKRIERERVLRSRDSIATHTATTANTAHGTHPSSVTGR